MSLNPGAIILPGRGTVFTAPTDQEIFNYKTVDPADPTTYTGWDCWGHTSRDNAVAINKDGGDPTQHDSWWTQGMRTSYAPTTWSATVNSLQVDALTLGLAFGGGTHDEAAGSYSFGDTDPVDRKLVILAVDATARMGIVFLNASITVGDAPQFDPENFFEIQLNATAQADDSGNRITWLHPALEAAAAPAA